MLIIKMVHVDALERHFFVFSRMISLNCTQYYSKWDLYAEKLILELP